MAKMNENDRTFARNWRRQGNPMYTAPDQTAGNEMRYVATQKAKKADNDRTFAQNWKHSQDPNYVASGPEEGNAIRFASNVRHNTVEPSAPYAPGWHPAAPAAPAAHAMPAAPAEPPMWTHDVKPPGWRPEGIPRASMSPSPSANSGHWSPQYFGQPAPGYGPPQHPQPASGFDLRAMLEMHPAVRAMRAMMGR